MTKISIEQIKELRDKTGASVTHCKEALEKANGNFEKAIESLRKKGQEMAAKKADRITSSGLVDCYIHPGGKVGVLLEMNCETDFVAKNEEFKKLVHDLAMHIAGLNPKYLKKEDAPKNKEEQVLYSQPFLKNPEITVEEYIHEKIGKIGENIQISRFVRYELGVNED